MRNTVAKKLRKEALEQTVGMPMLDYHDALVKVRPTLKEGYYDESYQRTMKPCTRKVYKRAKRLFRQLTAIDKFNLVPKYVYYSNFEDGAIMNELNHANK